MGVVMSISNRDVGFSQEEGVDLDLTLALGFSEREGGDLVEVVASIGKGFEVHVRDSHVHSLMITLYWFLLLLPQAWYFRINELRCMLSIDLRF
jgi:hypothetical protein